MRATQKKPKAVRSKIGRSFLSAEIDRDVRSKLAAVARMQDMTVPELLEEILRPELQRRMAAIAATAS